jgi:hypothetical protein
MRSCFGPIGAGGICHLRPYRRIDSIVAQAWAPSIQMIRSSSIRKTPCPAPQNRVRVRASDRNLPQQLQLIGVKSDTSAETSKQIVAQSGHSRAGASIDGLPPELIIRQEMMIDAADKGWPVLHSVGKAASPFSGPLILEISLFDFGNKF